MAISMFTGKGGVGKTTSAVAYALYLSNSQRVALIDHDGGHSVKRVLNIDPGGAPNTIEQLTPNLSLAVIESFDYATIVKAKEMGWSLGRYLAQFPGHLGNIPWADMLFHFFGAPTDVEGSQKFAALVQTLTTLKQQGVDNIIIDVEPTEGLRRLLAGSASMTRSLRNLGKTGWLMLSVLGAKWPDIKGYLQRDYFKNIEAYCTDMQAAVDAITKARFFLVCTPELGPVEQTFEVKAIIEGFGGKARGYVVNNIRDEPHEAENIALLTGQGLPMVKIYRDNQLHSAIADRQKLLAGIGEEIAALTQKSQ